QPDAKLEGTEKVGVSVSSDVQLQLFVPKSGPRPGFVPPLGIKVMHGTLDSWKGRPVDTVVIAQGFEERTKVSAERILSVVRPRRVLLVRYEPDQGLEIAKRVSDLGIQSEFAASPKEMSDAIGKAESVIVDTSGLSKPFLFV